MILYGDMNNISNFRIIRASMLHPIDASISLAMVACLERLIALIFVNAFVMSGRY